jgi:replication-associated recombination protein RarA
VGQPVVSEIGLACEEPDLFAYGGERWLFESDGVAGCGKTSAAYVTADVLGIARFNVEKIDSRATSIAELREIADQMLYHGWGPSGRRAYIIDEIQHLNPACLRFLLGWLESLPRHVIVIGTTTSITWADDVDGLYSRWRRFRFRKPSASAVAEHLERIARAEGMPIPPGFRFLSYLQGKADVPLAGNNVRDAIDQLRGVLNRKADGAKAVA